mmetsp:Transcript_86982/g.130416  ORF Transcript_86982/g.130416 Transcript_86982/m.130416 type:complete len:837 (-) Transcript_86982:22-2532(-)|eukprot:CAMPEP_0117010072 /NCGR_PEP_ID=MMETSP0472-20121206/8977_1 /TAXON_ID=693140 ORGANISM="Tiarina fusus, Strain LIS" /NCGR_SAMPLE_ID=MMETSP0472 /ASSEMBLY_ACC=CAM_ASM_000603 /LENGTH=836 /DNA_ID=CAMNT_0004712525 /DNA_START=12 /DNA_END=2525 /DNA_ORIENTATION=+
MADWKVYVHYEDEQLEHTALVKCSPQDNVSNVVSEFAKSIRRAYPKAKIDASKYQLTRGNGKVVKLSQTIAGSSIIPKEDLFVVLNSSSDSTKRRIPTEEDKQKADSLKQQGNALMSQKEYTKAAKLYSEALEFLPENAILFSNRSQAYLNSKKYQAALEDSKLAIKYDTNFAKAYLRGGKAAFQLGLFQEAKSFFVDGLNVTKRKSDKLSKTMSNEFQKLIEECNLSVENEKLDKEKQKAVVEEFQRSISQMKELFSKGKLKDTRKVCEDVLRLLPGEKLSSHYLSTILLAARKYKEVVSVLEPAVKAHPNELELRISLGEAYYHTGDHSKAIKIFTDIDKLLADPKDNERVSVRVARHLVKVGQEETASKLIMGILQKNENNPEALVEYGNLLFEKGVLREAIKVFLRALVLNSEDKTIRRKLAVCVSSPGGLNFLLEDLQDANSSSALAFLALIFKDFGALSQSEQLFKSAAELDPTSATYWLNYIHVLEILVKYQEAFDCTSQFLLSNGTSSLPFVDDSGSLLCSDIHHIIEGLKDVSSVLSQRSDTEGTKFAAVYTASDKKQEHKCAPEQLDLLAVLFTLVKILYVTGNLQLVFEIISKVELVRSGKQLHMTTIRNEHAYYCCIAQLMPYISFPLPDHEPLFVVGDSHTLPTAWQTVTIKEKKRLLVPKLVTGCKMWHLRKEAFFFPKANFDNIINTLPNGSDAIFLFGEIDCREGILVAIEKCRYETVEEGIEHTIDIYMEKLKEVKKQKAIQIFVHPVIPVLDETRNMVKQFNEVLERRVNQTNDFHWLDFFNSLLTEDGANLCPDFALDGTHMNPSYLKLLEASINSS